MKGREGEGNYFHVTQTVHQIENIIRDSTCQHFQDN